MATAGFRGTFEVSTNGTTWETLGGAYDASFDRTMEELDATEFGDTDEQKIYGLGNAEFSVSANWNPGDDGQGIVQAGMQARDNIHVRYRPDGTNGFITECICTSMSLSQAVDGKVEVEYTFVLANGTVTFE